MHDPRHIANEFINLGLDAGRPLTHLQIQKLVYFAHAWMLALHKRPLVKELFEAWRYGPVSPSIYHNLSRFRAAPIDLRDPIPLHPDDHREFDRDERNIIDQVFELYSELNGIALSQWTHAPGTPWEQAEKKHHLYISNDYIQRYYSDIVKKERAS